MEAVIQVHQLQIIDGTDCLNVKHLGALIEIKPEGHVKHHLDFIVGASPGG
jgi:hypothetical protein